MTWPILPKPLVPVVGERDISHFTPQQQHSIVRNRKMESEAANPPVVVDDFFA